MRKCSPLRKIANSLAALSLSVLLVLGMVPVGQVASAYAEPASNAGLDVPDDGDSAASGTMADAETVDNDRGGSDEGDASSSSAIEAVVGMDAFEFVYIDQKSVGVGSTQSIAISFTEKEHAATSVLYYQKEGGELQSVEPSKIVDGAALFSIPFESVSDCGTYSLVKAAWAAPVAGEAVISVDEELGYSFAVEEEIVSSDEGVVSAYSLDDSGNLSEESDLSEAITEKVDDQAGSEQVEAAALASAVADEEVALAASSARSSNGMVIALDAGHGGSDPGAENNGLIESNLTLSIARYCRDELSKYRNVTIFMVRDSDEYVGLSERVDRAVGAGADLFVSFHINATEGATGFEVWVQNDSSWRYYLHEESADLGDRILDKLCSLGLKNRGNKESDSTDYTNPDGSASDRLAVLRCSRNNNLPAVLIEHGFIDGASADRSLLSSEEGLRAMGVADAQAIAEKYGLKVNEPMYGFSDVYEETEHSSEIGWLAASGISSGFPDGSFGGTRDVARADMAAFLYRLAGSPDYTPTAADKARFWDVDETTSHAKEIWWMASSNITTGFGDGSFRGYDSVTRQDAAAFLRRFVASQFDMSPLKWTVDLSTVSFSDVDSSTPHREDILWLASMGVASGFSDGTYRGGNSVVRQDMAAFLYRLNNLPCFFANDDQKTAFSDVTESTPHANAIWWMAGDSISTGFPDGTFGAERNVARQDVAAFLYRLAGSPDYTPSAADKAKFSDVNESTDHSKEIWWLASVGIAGGFADGTFRGMNPVTRADMAAFLQRFYDAYSENSAYTHWAATDSAKLRFKDVNESTSHCDSVWWLGATGISNGFSDGSYQPDSCVTRQDLAEFLFRLYVRCYRSSDGQLFDLPVVTSGYKIMGDSSYNASQLVSLYNETGKSYPSWVYCDKGAATIDAFAEIVVDEANTEGVKPEVVFCQAMWETGWLQFTGDVKAEQCNFAGLGATGGGATGASFSSVREGIRAQVQHLKAYASTKPLVGVCVDPRFEYVTRGCAPTLEDLNGKWAVPGDGYGQNIRALISRI